MHSSRFVPTTAESGRLIHRPRLTLALADRFERRLTTVVAAAGCGKTAAMALAVENNLLDPVGRDVWLSATPRDADVEHFASGLARAFDVDNTGGADDVLERVHDAVWAEAPGEVALLIDDAHLVSSAAGHRYLLGLVDELPTNAHLVFASRTPLGLPTARLRAHGQLAELTDRDLELSNDEIEVLIAHRLDADGRTEVDLDAALPRHAATADLALAAGHTAGADFLWEEILTHIDGDRLADLQRASVVEVLDGELVAELTDRRFDLDGLVADIPLTERRQDTVRLHALLREALGARMAPTEQRKAQEIAAEFERRRGRWADAVQLFQSANDPVAAYDTIRDFACAPVLFRSVEDNIVVLDAIRRLRPGSGLALAVESSQRWMSQSSRPDASAEFTRTLDASIDALRSEGEPDLEAVQIHLRLQAGFLAKLDIEQSDIDRLAELREQSEIALLLYAFNLSALHADRGDVEQAIRALDAFESIDGIDIAQWYNERLADLGRFEDIDWEGAVDEVQDTAMMSAFARWLRGDVDPAIAYLVVQDLLPQVLRRGFDLVSVSILGVAVAIGTAAGESAAARRWCDQATAYLGSGLIPSAEYFARLAQAIVHAAAGDEEAAAAALDPSGTHVRFDGWPARPLLLSIPLIYLVRPDSRAMFDRCEFGHALTVAVQAGRALAALRDDSDPEPARELPWDEVNLLRANLLPVHLVELAAAAHGCGHPTAGDVATATPHLSRLARLASDRLTGRSLEALGRLTNGAPLTAPHQLTTTVLGDITLRRDDAAVDDDRWNRRAKIRELWAYLVVHRQTTRADLVRELWPDSRDDPDAERKALTSLRTALSMLNSILEPDRPGNVEPFFITSDQSSIRLRDAVVSDLDLLQEAADSAQAADNAGLPLEALRHHRRVTELHRGPLADSIDASWVVFERLRTAALAIGSACRVAELHLGRGEPEAAAQWAQHARQHDATSERAGRLFVEALAASGDRTNARAAAAHLRGALSDAGLDLEPATKRTFERLFGP